MDKYFEPKQRHVTSSSWENSFQLLKVAKDWLRTDSLTRSLSLDPELGSRVSPDPELTGSTGKTEK